MLVLAIEGLGAEELGYKLGFLKFLSLTWNQFFQIVFSLSHGHLKSPTNFLELTQ